MEFLPRDSNSSKAKSKHTNKMKRCDWVPEDNELYTRYHDEEWGIPVHDDQHLFEMLILEGAQAGLSWLTVLKKREAYREAFDSFDPRKVAEYDENKEQELLKNEGIIRNKLKIRAAIQNAKSFLEIQKEFGSFDTYLWKYVNNTPIKNAFSSYKDMPTKTKISDILSKDLKKRGMNFVGSTIIYAYMQAIGR
jgi:DNA-3-methyladenine glycosylase I